MKFIETECTFQPLTEKLLANSHPFECENPDLNDFFKNDCVLFSKQLLGKTYCFTLDKDPKSIVCAFTISNDSIKTSTLPNSRVKKVNLKIPHQKRFNSYPAVLIGRLGVDLKFNRRGIGTELMDFIKSWFIDENNKTGCRFIVVDSYNNNSAINYYTKNGFSFLFSSEEQEKEHTSYKKSGSLKTRLMFFDLLTLVLE